MKNSAYQKRIRAETEKICPKEVFASASYLRMMKSVAWELTGGKPVRVSLYDFPGENRMGWCDGRTVGVNYGNNLTASFHTMEQQSLSLTGVLTHECGHKVLSDNGLRMFYIKGILEGIWYPRPPKPQNEEEKKSLEQIRYYFEKKEQMALSLIVQVAGYLHNLLEDVYVEEIMCRRFRGSAQKGILLNRERNVEWLPSLRELLREKEDAVTILMNLFAQYVLSGKVNNWSQEKHPLLDTVKEAIPVIQKGICGTNPSSRVLAVNQVILKIWKYLYDIIREMESEKEKEEDAEKSKDQEQEDKEEANSAEQEKQKAAAEESGTNEQENTDREATKGQEDEKQEVSPMEAYLKHLAARMPKFVEDPTAGKQFRGLPKDVSWDGDWDANWEVPEGEESKEAAKIPVTVIDTESSLQELLYQMAKERVDVQIDAEIQWNLQKEMNETAFDAGHRKVKKSVCRLSEISEQQEAQYQEFVRKAKKIQHRLQTTVLPFLNISGTRRERRLFMGKKIDMRSIAQPQGAIYCKDYPGKKLDAAMAVLLDLSESMSGQRIEQAKLAALCLYEFCRKAGIPVLVYGHHTDGFFHQNLEQETVYLHSCAEFEPDRKDCYRITALKPKGANRDGVAIRFIGRKLAQRTEHCKLFVLISDGLPNSNQYRGETAKKDLIQIKKELTGQRISFLAAAIGEDKERIRDIYQNAFLDISNIEALPVTLAKKVAQELRRN